MKRTYLWIAFWAFFGGISRYALTFILPNQHFPIATLTANLLGAFLLICINAIAKKQKNTSQAFYKGLSVGFVGSFTTFSTFSYENLTFLQSGQWFNFIVYSLISLIGGLCMSWLAFYLMNKQEVR